jgi:HipA-like protein
MGILKSLKAIHRLLPRKPGQFVLHYHPAPQSSVTVGHLSFDGKVWTFTYDDEYKRRPDLRPIEGFDDLDRVYQSSELFPFFAVRIPDVDRHDVKQTLEEYQLRNPDSVDLLRIFGRRVVSSPAFELLPAA